ncbi:putative acyl-CoA dehydrogenase AidB [Cyphellophora attinorum]|uniref:Putative acyl-CoA dehydrogenase AidB n=1 Tax=Cyphellophora attinorum TaxID=1664694 RepID=A0A0N1HNN1_9EURO|nr:putative acyl-CoA dehydrogenase AidB [Phialophora attinorum]KPI39172.1 putative acyl-CoA dehydrogenase AidB [Phialophora attinorum]
MPTLTPSSLTSGFFQELPTVLPAYTSHPSAVACTSPGHVHGDDPVVSRLIALYLPSPTPSHIPTHLHNLSRQVISPDTLAHTIDADTNPPTLHPLTTFGAPNNTNALRTSPGWKALKDIQTNNGVVGNGYPQPPDACSSQQGEVEYNLRVHQFLTLHIWEASAAVVTCPVAMTDGAAVLLRKELGRHDLDAKARKVFGAAYERLISNDPKKAWTSGQWMTERSGGSSVAGTETVARKMGREEIERERRDRRDVDTEGNALGEWLISGFKWFSSATDADCVVLLAKTEKGISAFYAPMRRALGGGKEGSVMNGVQISRLKNKLGTKAVPTAELVIDGMRGWLLGEEGKGVRMISAILNITRLHTAQSGVGMWRGGLAASRAFTRVRKVQGGKRLEDNVQHMKWMADETVAYRAMTNLYMFGVALLGHTEYTGPTTKAHEMSLLPEKHADADALLRLLTPVMKACCSLRAVEGLRACMESLGGVGYCENNEDDGVLNIARLFRDANVNPIWEGTTSVLAEDIVRALQIKTRGVAEFEKVYGQWLQKVVASIAAKARHLFNREIRAVQAVYLSFKRSLQDKSEEQILWQGRSMLAYFEAITTAIVLMADACVDLEEVAIEVARRWVRMKVSAGRGEVEHWAKEVDLDRKIFLGQSKSPASESAGNLSKL